MVFLNETGLRLRDWEQEQLRATFRVEELIDGLERSASSEDS